MTPSLGPWRDPKGATWSEETEAHVRALTHTLTHTHTHTHTLTHTHTHTHTHTPTAYTQAFVSISQTEHSYYSEI